MCAIPFLGVPDCRKARILFEPTPACQSVSKLREGQVKKTRLLRVASKSTPKEEGGGDKPEHPTLNAKAPFARTVSIMHAVRAAHKYFFALPQGALIYMNT
jgi:hypothetical protein